MGGTLFDDLARRPGWPAAPRTRRRNVIQLVLAFSLASLVIVAALWYDGADFGPASAPAAISPQAWYQDGRSSPLAEGLEPSDPELGDGTTALELLRSRGAPADLRVVFTNDTTVNCGLALAERPSLALAAGCYSLEHSRTLFVYWLQEAGPEARRHVLLHEYGHFMQYDDAWDVMMVDNLTRDAAVERDADCRAIAMVDGETDETCDIADWHWDWLAEQKGVVSQG